MTKNIRIMYAIALLQGMVFYSPIATLYRQAHGITVFQMTVMESISLALSIALEIPWGIAADKIGYRKTMVFCSGLYFISKLVFWKATGFGGFFTERILLSVVLAGLSGVDASILYLSCKGKDSQRVFGIYDSIGTVGLLISAGVFAVVVRDNYALAGLLTVISYGLAALLSLGLTEVMPASAETGQTEPFHKTIQETLGNQTLLVFLIAAALLSETHQTITVFFNQLQYERCGLSSSAIGVLYIVATMLGLLGVYSSCVSKRMGRFGSLVLFCGMNVVSCLVLGGTKNGILSVAGVFALRVSNTLFQPLQTELQNRQIKTEHRATALSAHAMVMDCIAIGTNLVFGLLADWSLPSAFFFGGSICMVSILLFLYWKKKEGVPCIT